MEKSRKRQKERNTMEEKLIIAVSSFPVLYDASLFVYRDNQKNNDAWRKVADLVGEVQEQG